MVDPRSFWSVVYARQPGSGGPGESQHSVLRAELLRSCCCKLEKCLTPWLDIFAGCSLFAERLPQRSSSSLVLTHCCLLLWHVAARSAPRVL